MELLMREKHTFNHSKSAVTRERKMFPINQGRNGRPTYNYKATAKDAVCGYIEAINSGDGHILTIHIRSADRSLTDECQDTDNIIIFHSSTV